MRRSPLLALCAAALFGVLTPQPVNAAADTDPPALTVSPRPAFVVGTTISAAGYVEDDWYTGNVSQRVQWNATDSSGICGYDVRFEAVDGYIGDVYDRTSVRSFRYVTTDYNGSEGGSGQLVANYLVTAHDCAGNDSTAMVPVGFTITQENGAGLYNAPSPSSKITYTGTWDAAACACASGGRTKRTAASGAAATFTARYDRGDHVALVMAKGPARGKFDVYLDGTKLRTVDTYAPTRQDRVVVFDRWMAAGTHTVKIVNHATPGRAQIELDAVLTD